MEQKPPAWRTLLALALLAGVTVASFHPVPRWG